MHRAELETPPNRTLVPGNCYHAHRVGTDRGNNATLPGLTSSNVCVSVELLLVGSWDHSLDWNRATASGRFGSALFYISHTGSLLCSSL